MNTIKNVFVIIGQRESLDELRREERARLRVVRARMRMHATHDEHYQYLEMVERGHERNIVALAKAIGNLDKQIKDIFDDMELSANRQKGADNGIKMD